MIKSYVRAPRAERWANALGASLSRSSHPRSRQQTSGGTVLSTNWKEVAKTDYEKSITPPDGMELKKYGQ